MFALKKRGDWAKDTVMENSLLVILSKDLAKKCVFSNSYGVTATLKILQVK